MKPKTLALLLVAVVCGLTAAWITANYGVGGFGRATESEKKTVWVPLKDIKAGQKITVVSDFFKPVAMDANNVQAEWIADQSELLDKTVGKPLPAGSPLTKKDLSSGAPIFQLLKKGMRAMSVSASPTTAGSGFLLPGNRADVMCTIPNKDNERLTKMFLYNVLILAVGDTDTKPQDKNTIPPTTVTLALTPDDAERVAWVANQGQVTFAIRGTEDTDDRDIKKTPGAINPFAKDDNPFGGKKGESGAAGVTASESPSMASIPMAIKDVEIMQRITVANFDEFFKVVNVPPVIADNSLTKDQLLAKTVPVYSKVMKGQFVVPGHFAEEAIKGPRSYDTVVFRNGPTEVKVQYDGRTGARLVAIDAAVQAEQPAKPGEARP